MPVLSMSQLNLANQRLLIRQDLNVPVSAGRVTSDARIRASIPTIRAALEGGARVRLMSHLGRPVEGEYDEKFSLRPVAEHLQSLLGEPVALQRDWLDGADDEASERIILCENVRFNIGENANDEALSRRMAQLCDIYVMDAFGTAHRAQASTHGVARYAKIACAGPLLMAELEALGKALSHPARPLLAIVGGAKVSTKLTVLENLADKVDQLIVGGGIANTFIAGANHGVGTSLYEADLIPTANALSKKLAKKGGAIPMPTDVVVSKAFSADAEARVTPVENIADDEMILDLGPSSCARLSEMIKQAGTIVWNGPVGVFEFPQFANGTRTIATAIAESKAFSIAGGGETLAAIDQFGVAGAISYISTGGGAFLEFLEGKKLPAVAILEQRAQA